MADDIKGQLKFWNLWKTVIRNYFTRDMSDEGPVRHYDLYASSNALYSKENNVTFMYTLDGYPATIPMQLKRRIRDHAKGNVRVSFISLFEPTTIAWNSAKMRSKLNTWEKTSKSTESVNAFNVRKQLGLVDSNSRRSETLLYLADAEMHRGRKLFNNPTLMLVSGTRGEVFNNSIESITKYIHNLGITATRVDSDIEEYLRFFSPFSMEANTKIVKEIGNNTVTDEILARYSTYDQGKVGNGSYYGGTDINSGYHVMKEFKSFSGAPENMLICGETGSGKSFYGKSMFIQLLANSQYNGTIMDIEGGEYTPLANYIASGADVVVLNMAEGTGAYFDPMEIVQVGDETLDKDMFSLSSSCARSIVHAIVGELELAQQQWINTILESLLSETYARRGVLAADRRTWERSRGLTLHDMYAELVNVYNSVVTNHIDSNSLLQQTMISNPDMRGALDLLMLRMNSYFADTSGNKQVFKNRVTMSEVANAKLLICSFGLEGKPPTAVDTAQLALSQIYAAHISHMRSLFSKKSGKYNFKVWEEFQRWGQIPGSFDTINTSLTGGRKLGDLNFVMTNKPNELLENDRFGILENTTSSVIGAIPNAATRRELCDRLSISHLLPELNKIVMPDKMGTENTDLDDGVEESNSGDLDDKVKAVKSNSRYMHAFLVNFDRKDQAIVKMQLPLAISMSKLLATGVDLDKNVSTGIHSTTDRW